MSKLSKSKCSKQSSLSDFFAKATKSNSGNGLKSQSLNVAHKKPVAAVSPQNILADRSRIEGTHSSNGSRSSSLKNVKGETIFDGEIDADDDMYDDIPLLQSYSKPSSTKLDSANPFNAGAGYNTKLKNTRLARNKGSDLFSLLGSENNMNRYPDTHSNKRKSAILISSDEDDKEEKIVQCKRRKTTIVSSDEDIPSKIFQDDKLDSSATVTNSVNKVMNSFNKPQQTTRRTFSFHLPKNDEAIEKKSNAVLQNTQTSKISHEPFDELDDFYDNFQDDELKTDKAIGSSICNNKETDNTIKSTECIGKNKIEVTDNPTRTPHSFKFKSVSSKDNPNVSNSSSTSDNASKSVVSSDKPIFDLDDMDFLDNSLDELSNLDSQQGDKSTKSSVSCKEQRTLVSHETDNDDIPPRLEDIISVQPPYPDDDYDDWDEPHPPSPSFYEDLYPPVPDVQSDNPANVPANSKPTSQIKSHSSPSKSSKFTFSRINKSPSKLTNMNQTKNESPILASNETKVESSKSNKVTVPSSSVGIQTKNSITVNKLKTTALPSTCGSSFVIDSLASKSTCSNSPKKSKGKSPHKSSQVDQILEKKQPCSSTVKMNTSLVSPTKALDVSLGDTGGLFTIDQILKHPVLRVSELEPEDCAMLQDLQTSLQEMMSEAFLSLPLELLKQHIPNYDAVSHKKLIQAYCKIANAKARYSSIAPQASVKSNTDDMINETVTIPKRNTVAEKNSLYSNNHNLNNSKVADNKGMKLMPLPIKNSSEKNSCNGWSSDIADETVIEYKELSKTTSNPDIESDLDDSISLVDTSVSGSNKQINYSKVIYKPESKDKSENKSSIQSTSNSPVKFQGNVRNDGPTGEFSGMNYPHTREMMKIFHQKFGLRRFRENQKEICNAALLGKDCFVLMPTGGGKSLCYQLPACINDGVSIVISPLKSLIQDQVQKLASLDVAAARFSGDISPAEENSIYTELMKREPTIKLLYVTPEKISASQKFVSTLENLYQRKCLARFVIDEAHCVSQWGHDFRPDYKKLNMLRVKFPGVPTIALTATATPRVRIDILHQLGLTSPKWFLSSFNRANLHYDVVPKKGKKITADIVDMIKSRFSGMCGIIYCLSRKECDTVAGDLNKARLSAVSYHAGLTDLQRSKAQNAWLNDKCKVVVATIAFGMGIDKPDVRFVIHHSLPKSIEGYYQESGRAGRDGEDAWCTLFYGYQDMHRLKKMIELDRENFEAKKTHYNNLYRMVAFCENKTDCRRTQLLNYFGEIFDRLKCLNNKRTSCDNCQHMGEFSIVDVTKEARAIVLAVQQLCSGGRWTNNFTVNHIVDVFKGSEAKKVIDNGHNRHPLHGVGKTWNRSDSERLIHRLVLMGYLKEELVVTRDDIANSYLRVGPKAPQLLNNNSNEKFEFEMKKDDTKKSSGGAASAAGSSSTASEDSDPEILTLQKECYAALLAEVKAIAEEKGVNYTNVVNMVALREMSKVMPESEEEMRNIPHITQANYIKYGQRLLDITQRYAANKLVLLIDRDDQEEEFEAPAGASSGNSDSDKAMSWLASVAAPDPPSDSPYFGQVTSRGRRGRAGFKYRRGRGKKRATSAGKMAGSGESYQVRVARQAAARRKAAAAVVLKSARGGFTSSASAPKLMGAPTPRSFLPPPRVVQM